MKRRCAHFGFVLCLLMLNFYRARSHRPVVENCGNPHVHGGMVVQRYFIGKDSLKANPWTVMIMKKKTKTVRCLGVLLPSSTNSSSTVLTAAQCVKKSPVTDGGEYRMKVYSGVGKISPVTKTKVGKKSKPIQFDPSASPVCLGSEKGVVRNEICYISMFSNGELTTMPATVVPTDHCIRNSILETFDEYGVCVKQLKSKDFVVSGSPLVCLRNGKVHLFGVHIALVKNTHRQDGNAKLLGYFAAIPKESANNSLLLD
uniref:Peptidase S1 domain-containing protein n=1 Tax=Trichuris muris TaxID=70415 RepID=A0A5S6QV80_TRIMR